MNTTPPVYKKRELVVTRRIEGELVLVPIQYEAGDLEQIYLLNEVGAYIWDLIDGNRDLETIRAAVLAEFEVEPAVLSSDLDAYIQKLLACRCIEPAAASQT